MREVFFVAPLPPPIHGFSAVSERMLELLLGSGRCSVLVSDMTPRSIGVPFKRWASFAKSALCADRSQTSLYLALSGGPRQLIDLGFALVARLRGIPLFVHHHSFSYLNARPWHARLTLRIMRPAVHIVLCGRMAERLCSGYGIRPDRLRILSNAAFVPSPEQSEVRPPRQDLVIGFLSNITAEKGVFDFFQVISEARAAGLPCSGVLAGPVQDKIADSFMKRLDAADCVSYVGPVYGKAKEAFLSSTDVLLFPAHRDEAEPVTIIEALSHGTPVVARNRGCIGGMVPDCAGRAIDEGPDFVQQTVDLLRDVCSSAEVLESMRQHARDTYLENHQISRVALDMVLAEIAECTSEQAVD